MVPERIRRLNAAGFGTAELAVTLALVAVLTAVSAPSLVASWRAATLRAAADELAAAVNVGRLFAIAHNVPVCIAVAGADVRFEGGRAGTCSGVGLPGAAAVRLASGLVVRTVGPPVVFTGPGRGDARGPLRRRQPRRRRNAERGRGGLRSREDPVSARGFTLVEILVATLILSVGIVAVASGLHYAIGGVEVGRGETAAVFLAEQRLELLKSAALEDWSSTLLAAGIVVEAYGTIAGAAPYRRETVVADHVGRECATGAPPTVTCKRVRVTVSYRPVSGGGGPGHERRVDLVTVFVPRI